ncbi:T9SS type A sorting domain-containing protein [Flavobacterium sp.]|uniref:T9SS type A sorting domain-containing protein n=1 Tax=Flavobacterium sp. TaxID=239 RepID=UPI003C386DBF
MKKHLLKITALSIMFISAVNAQDGTFNNGSGDGLWGTAANWAPAGVPTGIATLSANPTVSAAATVVKIIAQAPTGDRIISGTGELTINGSTTGQMIQANLTDGALIFNNKVTINTTSAQNIDTKFTANNKLVFSSTSTLNLLQTAKLRNYSVNPTEFNGVLMGTGTLTVSSTTTNPGTGNVVFGSTANNATFAGSILTFTQEIVSNIISPQVFLPTDATMLFNSTGGTLTLNGANTMQGKINRSAGATAGTSIVNFNANQTNMGLLLMSGSASPVLKFVINGSVSNLTFSSTSPDWGTGTLDIVGFKDDVLTIGGTSLTTDQLNAITLNGVAQTAGYFSQRANGFIVKTTSLGVKENTLEGVSIYPNPATDVLNVTAPEGSIIEIYNTLGAIVKTAKETNLVPVSDLASGLYLVKVSKNGQFYQDKIVKK